MHCRGLSSIIMLMSWAIWKHRNVHIFDGQQPPVSRLFYELKDEALLWANAGATTIMNIAYMLQDAPALVILFSPSISEKIRNLCVFAIRGLGREERTNMAVSHRAIERGDWYRSVGLGLVRETMGHRIRIKTKSRASTCLSLFFGRTHRSEKVFFFVEKVDQKKLDLNQHHSSSTTETNNRQRSSS